MLFIGKPMGRSIMISSPHLIECDFAAGNNKGSALPLS